MVVRRDIRAERSRHPARTRPPPPRAERDRLPPRDEADRCEILSGVFEGRTLGTPIAILVRNEDARPEAYPEMKDDLPSVARRFHLRSQVWHPKLAGRRPRFGPRNDRARRRRRGRPKSASNDFSGPIEIVAYVTQIHEVAARIDRASVTQADVERNTVRCPDGAAAELMIALIESVRAEGDSFGGVIECVVRGVPAGLGEPVFDKLEADLAKAMLSLPATKGFEIGSGFAATRMKGSEHNDAFEIREKRVGPRRIIPAACRAGSATARTSSFASPSSRPPQLRATRRQ